MCEGLGSKTPLLHSTPKMCTTYTYNVLDIITSNTDINCTNLHITYICMLVELMFPRFFKNVTQTTYFVCGN